MFTSILTVLNHCNSSLIIISSTKYKPLKFYYWFCLPRLNVRDLKPNIGLFWYFFTEMFGHFHLLFICTFQINAFIYMIPLTIRFFNEPSILIYSFCALMSIFKSYPCIGDVGFYLALLPMWKHLFPCKFIRLFDDKILIFPLSQ